MKTMIEIIVVILIIVALNFVASNFLNKEVEYYSEMIDNIYKNIQNNKIDQAYKDIDSITERWENTHVIWSILSAHEDLENVELIIKKLKDHNVTSDITVASIELIELKGVLEHNANNYFVNIENIF